MTVAFLIQAAISLVAVMMLVALAGWAGVARPCPPLDAASAAAVLAEEFPDERPDHIWIAGDGQGAIARAGERALVLFRVGDVYVARTLEWAVAVAAPVVEGRIALNFGEIGAPGVRLLAPKDGGWPSNAEAAA